MSVHACHCTDCQALSGSAFGLSMVLSRHELEIEQGKIGVNEFSASKNLMHRHYCENCGVAIWFSSPGYEGIIALKPGTLDDTTDLQPIAHMWYRSAQSWLKLADDLPVYQEQPSFDELLELARASRQV